MTLPDKSTHDLSVTSETRDEVMLILLHLEDCRLKCEWMTMMVSQLLTGSGVEHKVYCGYVVNEETDDMVLPHYWVESGGYCIDLRLRAWLGDSDRIPHGVFDLKDSPSYPVTYRGVCVEPVQIDREDLDNMSDGRYAQAAFSMGALMACVRGTPVRETTWT